MGNTHLNTPAEMQSRDGGDVGRKRRSNQLSCKAEQERIYKIQQSKGKAAAAAAAATDDRQEQEQQHPVRYHQERPPSSRGGTRKIIQQKIAGNSTGWNDRTDAPGLPRPRSRGLVSVRAGSDGGPLAGQSGLVNEDGREDYHSKSMGKDCGGSSSSSNNNEDKQMDVFRATSSANDAQRLSDGPKLGEQLLGKPSGGSPKPVGGKEDGQWPVAGASAGPEWSPSWPGTRDDLGEFSGRAGGSGARPQWPVGGGTSRIKETAREDEADGTKSRLETIQIEDSSGINKLEVEQQRKLNPQVVPAVIDIAAVSSQVDGDVNCGKRKESTANNLIKRNEQGRGHEAIQQASSKQLLPARRQKSPLILERTSSTYAATSASSPSVSATPVFARHSNRTATFMYGTGGAGSGSLTGSNLSTSPTLQQLNLVEVDQRQRVRSWLESQPFTGGLESVGRLVVEVSIEFWCLFLQRQWRLNRRSLLDKLIEPVSCLQL